MKRIISKALLPFLCTIVGGFAASAVCASGAIVPDEWTICAYQVGDGNSGECAACCSVLTGSPNDADCWNWCKTHPNL